MQVPGPPLPLLKVEERSITVKSHGTDKEGPRELTFVTDPKQTRVRFGVVTDQQATEGGGTRTSVKFRPGSLADLQVGQQLRLTVDDELATEILILPPPPDAGDAKRKDKKPVEKK